jgi:hypothetical protein
MILRNFLGLSVAFIVQVSLPNRRAEGATYTGERLKNISMHH